MANQTYLQLVNLVLQGLRETPVGTVSYNSYSSLVGRWVNDAKRQVEDAWPWQALNANAPFNLTPGVLVYDIGVLSVSHVWTDRARLRRDVDNPARPMAFDITQGLPMQLIDRPVDWIFKTKLIQPTAQTQTQPMFFGLEHFANTVLVQLFETPLVVRNWQLMFTLPQEDLVNDNDIMLVPWYPVVAIATDIALGERGEEIGEPGNSVAQRANLHIDNAIALDSRDQPHLTTFYPG